jgi:hypothetical protein
MINNSKDTMKTLIIDIINDEAVKLIHDMEHLKLIRVRKEERQHEDVVDWVAKYKGAMQKQPMNEINDQLNDLRNSWE